MLAGNSCLRVIEQGASTAARCSAFGKSQSVPYRITPSFLLPVCHPSGHATTSRRGLAVTSHRRWRSEISNYKKSAEIHVDNMGYNGMAGSSQTALKSAGHSASSPASLPRFQPQHMPETDDKLAQIESLLRPDRAQSSYSINSLQSLIIDLEPSHISDKMIITIARLALEDARYRPIVQLLSNEHERNPSRGYEGDMSPFVWVVRTLGQRWPVSPEFNDFYLDGLRKDVMGAIEWCPWIWNGLMDHCDFRRSRALLRIYKSARHRQIEGLGEENGVFSGAAKDVAAPYTLYMRRWIKECMRKDSGIIRAGSLLPRSLAADLIGILGIEDLPGPFLRQWMNAERLAGHYDVAEMVWDRFSLHCWSERLMYKELLRIQKENIEAGRVEEYEADEAKLESCRRRLKNDTRPRANAHAYSVYFKLYKTLSNPTPLRPTIKTMLENLPRKTISTTLLNSLLSAIVTPTPAEPKIDLPLFYLVLCMYDTNPLNYEESHGPKPDTRTIDIAASGIARLWQYAGHSLGDLLLDRATPKRVKEEAERYKKDHLRSAIMPSEWELVKQSLENEDTVPLEGRRSKATIHPPLDQAYDKRSARQHPSDQPKYDLPMGPSAYVATSNDRVIRGKEIKYHDFSSVFPEKSHWNPKATSASQMQVNKTYRGIKNVLQRAMTLIIRYQNTHSSLSGFKQSSLTKAIDQVWLETGYIGPGLMKRSELLNDPQLDVPFKLGPLKDRLKLEQDLKKIQAGVKQKQAERDAASEVKENLDEELLAGMAMVNKAGGTNNTGPLNRHRFGVDSQPIDQDEDRHRDSTAHANSLPQIYTA